jgi:hypothetical protein
VAFPEIQPLFQALLQGIRSVLGDRLTGLYIFGSLASGDFVPGRSDLDFLAVTEAELPLEAIEGLKAMHARLGRSGVPLADHLEGSYIPKAALRCYDSQNAVHPALRVDGSFDLDFHASDWIIQRWLIRQHALTLAGPDPRSLIDPIQPAELRQAARGILRQWWAPMLDDSSRLGSSEYQAYAVLTMCRILYTVEHGEVISKAAAARWGQAELGDPWRDLITEAAAWRNGMPLDRLAETQAMIRFTLERARTFPVDRLFKMRKIKE